MNEVNRIRARKRALRAAQVVTLGLALAGVGCHGSTPSHKARRDHGGGKADNLHLADGSCAEDGGPDADPLRGLDAGSSVPADSGTLADGGTSDAGVCNGLDWWQHKECCDFRQWDGWGCVAWGPYPPPSMDASNPSRSVEWTSKVS